MRIMFIYSGAEHLGIEHISSFLKSKGHEVSLLFDPAVFSGEISINNKNLARIFSVDAEIVRKAVSSRPDIIAFSAYTGNYRWCLEIARNIRALSGVPIIFGGVHTAAVPERVLSNDFIDYAIIGEGEYAMLELIEHIRESKDPKKLDDIPNLCFKDRGEMRFNKPRPYIKDLDSLPFPDKGLFYDKIPIFEENYLIATSRGCPYDCTYCGNSMYNKIYSGERQSLRRRSTGNVIEELSAVKKRGRAKLVAFADDVFTSSKPWLEDFMEKYKSRVGLPFFCSVYPLTVTKDIAGLLKDGGCWRVTVGIQSGSERIRRDVFNRRGSNEKIAEAISYIKDAGLKVSVDNIFGAPSETEDDLKEGMKLYDRIKADRILTFWLTFYPKTSIVSFAKDQNMLSDNDVEKIEEGRTGYAFKTGSVSGKKVAVYARYELLLQLRSMIHSDRLYHVASKAAVLMPFKRHISMVVIFLNGVINRDMRLFYLLKYIWAKKKTP